MTLSLRDLKLLWCFGMCTFIMMDTLNSLIWFRVVAHTAAWYGRSSLKPEWILEPAGLKNRNRDLWCGQRAHWREHIIDCIVFHSCKLLHSEGRGSILACIKKIWWLDGGKTNRVYFHVLFSVLHCDSVLPRININKPPFRNQTVGRLSTRGPVKTDIL